MSKRNVDNNGIISPIVHLNGTSGGVLESSVTAAVNAVAHAMNKVMECNPHGRDYYVQAEGAYHMADAQHRSRLRRLADIRDELMSIMQNVRDQNGKR
jgi:hypothetical protein